MLTLDNMVRGEDQAFRVTFMSGINQDLIDVTGWTIFIGFGRSRNDLSGLHEISATADSSQGAAGQIPVTLLGSVIAQWEYSNVIIDLSVDTGNGKRIPILLAKSAIQSSSDYRQTQLAGSQLNGQLIHSSPMIVNGGEKEPQAINLTINNNLDPTFDLGVLVNFKQLDPSDLAYLELLRSEVSQKHSDVMGV